MSLGWQSSPMRCETESLQPTGLLKNISARVKKLTVN
jgi:hypothetical protein